MTGVQTCALPILLACEVKWDLESITTNKASGGDGIPVALFQILKDDAVKVLNTVQFSSLAQSCPTLGDPIDGSPSGSSVHGISQARVLEWGAIALSVVSCEMSATVQ